MRTWTAIPATVIAACLALSLVLWSQASGRTPEPVDPEPRTGMELLQAYRCHRAETKRIILRGVEDNFSVAGDEPTRVRDARRTTRTLSIRGRSAYDSTEPDRWLIDHIDTPARISGGLFVISLKPVAENGNDVVAIGDLSDSFSNRALFHTTPGELDAAPGWSRIGTVHYAELARISLDGAKRRFSSNPPPVSTPTLLDQIRSGGGETVIDVQVIDDTSVDFIGMAVCEQPPAGKGMTYIKKFDLPDGVAWMSCWNVPEGATTCDPMRGDTPCGQPLPIACHRPGEAPPPPRYRKVNTWSGGELAFSTPVAASRFRTVGEVDAFCRRQFGEGWRIATYHDGGGGGEVMARGDTRGLNSRVWVDIQDQPYGTCWRR